jgi:uncharacterized surface protein with fasciclin (FAS1) repeats
LNPPGLSLRIHDSRLNPCDFGSVFGPWAEAFASTLLNIFKGIHMQTKHKLASIGVALALSFAAIPSFAQVMVGGAPMLASKDIIDNAVNSKDHTTLVAAVKAAGLVDTLKGPGPFTVFAPTNAAFAALPAGTVDTLLKPENKGMLTGVLTYHVVPGKWDAAAISKMIADGKGMATIKTVAGGTLVAKSTGGKVTVTDEKGGWATVTIADVYQSNGVIHVVDKVLLPK